MNLTAISGFILAGTVVWFGVLAHASRPEIFLDRHALILVIGGTVAAALVAFPLRQYQDLLTFLLTKVLFPTKRAAAKVIAQVLMLSTRVEPQAIDPEIWRAFHPFLVEAYLISAKNDMTQAEFKMILQGRRQRFQERNAWQAKILTALAKFPPAFGLLGASTGMIAMMSNLGGGGKEVIGPSMAIALVATFWGIALANLVLLPLADRALRIHAEDAKLRLIISSGLILIHQETRPSIVLEHLLGFLPAEERNDPQFRQALFYAQNKVVGAAKKTAA